MLAFCCLLVSIKSLAGNKIDSIGIENSNNKKLILHKVEAKESYYSIARKYNVSPQSILNYNKEKALQIGIIIKVPTSLPFELNTNVKTETPQSNQTAELPIVEYKVGIKETLFAIAKKFNTTVDDIKSINNLRTNSLSVGQIIKVRYGVNANKYTPPTQVQIPVPIILPKTKDTTVTDSGINASERLRLPPAKYGLREIDERGVAVSIADQNLDGSKMLALHRTAPIGTVVKITNPMSGKSTFAKVVGKFSENESTKDVIIVVTKATAKLIGALDNRFQVSIVYGIPIILPTVINVPSEE